MCGPSCWNGPQRAYQGASDSNQIGGHLLVDVVDFLFPLRIVIYIWRILSGTSGAFYQVNYVTWFARSIYVSPKSLVGNCAGKTGA